MATNHRGGDGEAPTRDYPFYFREKDDEPASETKPEHITDGEEDAQSLCGEVLGGAWYGPIDKRMENVESVYDAIETEYCCPDCAVILLDRLGLPASREAANERVGREVY